MFAFTRKAMASSALLLLIAVQLSAQFKDMFGTNWNNPVSSFIGSSIYWRTMTGMNKKSATTPPPRSATVSYTPTATPLVPGPMARTFSSDKEQQKELETLFHQFLTLFDTRIASGPDRHNVASAAAFFMAVDYGVATGREVADPLVEALRDALQQGLLRHTGFQEMPERQRQQLAETFIICAMLARAGYQQGAEQKDAEQMKLYQDFARQSLKAVLGAEPEGMTFTPTGLTFKE